MRRGAAAGARLSQMFAATFRAVGVTFDALPGDYRMREPSRDAHLVPRAEYLAVSSRALREWVGRAVYRVMGYAR